MSDSPENSLMKRISYVNPTQSHRKVFLFFPKNSSTNSLQPQKVCFLMHTSGF